MYRRIRIGPDSGCPSDSVGAKIPRLHQNVVCATHLIGKCNTIVYTNIQQQLHTAFRTSWTRYWRSWHWVINLDRVGRILPLIVAFIFSVNAIFTPSQHLRCWTSVWSMVQGNGTRNQGWGGGEGGETFSHFSGSSSCIMIIPPAPEAPFICQYTGVVNLFSKTDDPRDSRT